MNVRSTWGHGTPPKNRLSYEEREARREKINLKDNAITTLMLRKDGKPVTVNDIFAHKTEALLMGKLLNVPETFIEQTLRYLKKEITPTNTHYRSSLRSGWTLTIKDFCALTPLYKSLFTGCTNDNMQGLLLSIRKDIIDGKLLSRKRYQKRMKNLGTEPETQETNCENPDRLTPLGSRVYSDFISIANLRRFGTDFMHASNEYRWRGTFKTIITTTGIVSYTNDTPTTRTTWKPLLKNLSNRSKLAKLNMKEEED